MTRIVVTGFAPDGTSTVVRDEELRVRPGDIVIQNGTSHAWHPSPTEGCEIAWVLVGATREPGPPQD